MISRQSQKVREMTVGQTCSLAFCYHKEGTVKTASLSSYLSFFVPLSTNNYSFAMKNNVFMASLRHSEISNPRKN